MFDPDRPYNDLPPLPPKVELETRGVLKACIEARAALASLDAEALQLPNPSILIASTALFEAQASSAIENIVTTHDALFQHSQLQDDTADPATKEAIRYREAIYLGYVSLAQRPLSVRTAVEICRTITGIEAPIRKLPGTALRNLGSGNAIYTPPDGEHRIRDLLANWETFLHLDSDLDPLVRLAVQHYQFEAIHPFLDGNGRTGRILNILFLIEQKLLRHPIVYLSREILESRDLYYSTLLDVTRQGAWTDWIEFVLHSISLSASRSSLRTSRFRLLMAETERHVRKTQPKLHSRELIDILFTQPYCRIANLVDASIAKRQTAAIYLAKLVDAGVLTEIQVGREKLFKHVKLHQLLTTDGRQILRYSTNALSIPQLLFPTTTARTS